MSESDDTGPEHSEADDAVFDEVREAAGAVIVSLKQLIDATERVVADPAAFAGAVDSGRTIVEAFLGGFAAQADPDSASEKDAPTEPPAERDESADES